jgi:hypothetical protein
LRLTTERSRATSYWAALSAAGCLVNMSESFRNLVLECWLSGGRVVVRRKCVAFSDLVVPGENGFLAAPSTEVAIGFADVNARLTSFEASSPRGPNGEGACRALRETLVDSRNDRGRAAIGRP